LNSTSVLLVLDLKGGLGSASVVMPDGSTVGALVVVNARGSVVTPGSGHFWAAPFELNDEFGAYGLCQTTPVKRLATVSHDGMARAIVPSHTLFDGDLVFAVSTGHATDTSITPDIEASLGHAASLCLSRAIARGVYEATAAEADLLPCWYDKFVNRQ